MGGRASIGLTALVLACSSARATEPATPRAPSAEAAGPGLAAETNPGPLADPGRDVDQAYRPEGGEDDEPEDGADEAEGAPEPSAAPPRAPHPLSGKSKKEIEALYRTDPASLGSISLGRPGAGALMNGVQMPKGQGWQLIDPAHAWGTEETVDALTRAIGAVRARYPDAHDVYVGHISARHGGALRPHISHQAGRDVDLSYFYRDDSARWYRRATDANLDRERSWAFVRALVTETDVELILIDRGLQKLLREHALAAGEDPRWVSGLFDGIPGVQRPLVFHAKGHATHLHVRFYNPVAQATAVLAHETLVAHGHASAATAFVSHRVRNGETLGMLARKYGTTVREIQRANGLRGTRIRAKAVVRIPKKGPLARPTEVLIPPRRLPPSSPGKNALR